MAAMEINQISPTRSSGSEISGNSCSEACAIISVTRSITLRILRSFLILNLCLTRGHPRVIHTASVYNFSSPPSLQPPPSPPTLSKPSKPSKPSNPLQALRDLRDLHASKSPAPRSLQVSSPTKPPSPPTLSKPSETSETSTPPSLQPHEASKSSRASRQAELQHNPLKI
ncbi:uncharacterized protein [Procambarus clarkii]|uniref:uncharacterized protein n=1 Tax=Procambarus clarkii TaxID=6728 RepID=UPI0037424B13